MPYNINEFRSTLKYNGARPSFFDVKFSFPTGGNQSMGDITALIKDGAYKVKASSFPRWTNGVIEVPYFGRNIKVPGTKKFENWSCTIICDEDFKLRHAFEVWSNNINSMEPNLFGFTEASPTAYKADMEISHYNKTGPLNRTYRMVGAWPVTVGDMNVAWEDSEKILEFPVEFAIDYFVQSGIGKVSYEPIGIGNSTAPGAPNVVTGIGA